MVVEHVEPDEVIILESTPTDRCDQCGRVAPGRYVFDVQGMPILFVCEDCDRYE